MSDNPPLNERSEVMLCDSIHCAFKIDSLENGMKFLCALFYLWFSLFALQHRGHPVSSRSQGA